jgi:hypothetical protein
MAIPHDPPAVFSDPIDYIYESIFVVALAVSAATLVLLARAGAGVGAWLAAAGHAFLMIPAGATAIAGREMLDPVFPLGVLAILAGFVTLAVSDGRKRLVFPGLGLLLLFGWIASGVVDGLTGLGGIVLAALWAGVAHIASARTERLATA